MEPNSHKGNCARPSVDNQQTASEMVLQSLNCTRIASDPLMRPLGEGAQDTHLKRV